jgi:hypothetical protein
MGPALDRFGPARVAAAGFASLTAGYTLFLRVGPAPDYPAVILPSLLLIGAAFGPGFAALNILATADDADHEQGWPPAYSRPPSRSAGRSCWP